MALFPVDIRTVYKSDDQRLTRPDHNHQLKIRCKDFQGCGIQQAIEP